MRIILSLSLLLLIGCVTKESQSSRRPSNDGNLNEYRDKIEGYAVRFEWDGDRFCSGLMIKPNQVLTAAHCIKKFKHESQREFNRKFNFYLRDRSLRIGQIRIYTSKSYDFEELRPKNTIGDIAVFQIGRPPDSEMYFSPASFVPNAAYLSFGFGPNPVSRSYAALNVTELIPHNEQIGRPYMWVFKNGPAGAGMICGGDSGSPLFTVNQGQLELVGVLSGVNSRLGPGESAGDRDCGRQIGESYWTSVQEFLTFVQNPEKEGHLLKLK